MRGRQIFSKYKNCLLLLSKFYSIFPYKARVSLLELHRNCRGRKGLAIRYALLKSVARQCGDNVAIYTGAYLLNPRGLTIGNNVSIHPMCYLECMGGVQIADNVSVAHGVTIMSTSHNHNDNTSSIKDQDCSSKPVVISENVWIGAKATILYGVSIGRDCIIGANSVVTKNCENNSIYVGSPAKKIKQLYESNISTRSQIP